MTEAKKGADGEYTHISALLQITGGQAPAATVATVGGQEQATAKTGEELDEWTRRMQGVVAQEAMRGRERFAGVGHSGVQEQEALLAQAKARQEEEASAVALAAATVAADAAVAPVADVGAGAGAVVHAADAFDAATAPVTASAARAGRTGPAARGAAVAFPAPAAWAGGAALSSGC